MRFREIVFAACAAMPALAWAQGVIPTNNAAIFSAQPVQTPSGTTTGTLATRWGNRLDLVADFGADPTGATLRCARHEREHPGCWPSARAIPTASAGGSFSRSSR